MIRRQFTLKGLTFSFPNFITSVETISHARLCFLYKDVGLVLVSHKSAKIIYVIAIVKFSNRPIQNLCRVDKGTCMGSRKLISNQAVSRKFFSFLGGFH